MFHSYIQETLDSDEVIVCQGKYHWLYTVQTLIPFILLSILVGWIFHNTHAYPSFVLLLPGIIWLLARMERKATTFVTVTNKKLVYQRGWARRRVTEVELERIVGCHLEQTPWEQALGYGRLTLVAAALDEIAMPRMLSDPVRFRGFVLGEHAGTAATQRLAREPEALPEASTKLLDQERGARQRLTLVSSLRSADRGHAGSGAH